MNDERLSRNITTVILQHYPTVQAIYLFGSMANGEEWPDSDADLGLLLPIAEAKKKVSLLLSPCAFELAELLGRDVDLLNLRQASTVIQHQVVSYGKLLYVGDEYAQGEFEMYTLSLYQKLNEERAAILEDFYRTKRAYRV
ncbi:MAG: nucleotidyltransferase domain-containing protein [Candidatus Electrothrix aestuarii]|uniref:Nucleotidyltransferase domain-containing protein n=1 Tax=Candidatus Electrothrix aestuarii TaxID=3062594 RepID=A0AAU8LU54_9BACT|nr:nucleotidyltransferase domain-containing protein [Candidatus Electrothrix aestuarii]